MGWEWRNGRRVYYRKVRVAGRVRSIYCGMGARGEQAAREDEERRARGAGRQAAATTPEPVAHAPLSLGDLLARVRRQHAAAPNCGNCGD